MSSPDRYRRRLLALGLLLPLLGGCSFSPLYGDQSAMSGGAGFAYAEPTNRYEQIIYQELAFRLGTDPRPEARVITVSASKSTHRVGRTSPSAVLVSYEAVVSASLKVQDPGEDTENLLPASRFAGASYEISGQVAADRAAEENAAERAARAVADTLRLIIAAARNKGDI